jgi:phosphoribosylformylglycinamidine synthase
VKWGVVTFPGSNDDRDTLHVLRHVLRHEAVALWHKERELHGVDCVVLPGGFSYGDYLRCGAIARFSPVMGAIAEFAARGGLVLGICNGFQALVNLGLLPMLDGQWRRDVALANNDCGNFQDRWVELAVEQQSPCLFTRGLKHLPLPVRHGEGKLVAEPQVLERLEAQGMVALRYADGAGRPARGRFPANPNGSVNDIAGICDPTGRVFGLMPHPEGFYRQSQHPDWTLTREKARRKGQELDPLATGGGMAIFVNAVEAARGALA